MQPKRNQMMGVRISESELAALKSALPALRRKTGEAWDLSRLVREGARMLADLAEEGVTPRGERGVSA